MSPIKIIVLLLALALLNGCAGMSRQGPNATRVAESISVAKDERASIAGASGAPTVKANEQTLVSQNVSLNHADQSQSIAEAMDRKIIRNADVTLEVASPLRPNGRLAGLQNRSGASLLPRSRESVRAAILAGRSST